MNPIFRYTPIIITCILTSTSMLILPAKAMEGPNIVPHVRVNPVVKLAQEDARSDVGIDTSLRWFAYGTGCWVFAVVHASVGNPTVPSHRLLGRSPEYVNTYMDAYKSFIKNQRMEKAAVGWVVSMAATLWLWNIFTTQR